MRTSARSELVLNSNSASDIMIATRIFLCSAFLFFTASLCAQEPPPRPDAENGVQELTRGPIHEAFGQPVVLNPQPGPVSAKEPPAPVEELPPDQKPEGDHVVWIPGYWQADDEAKDFVWVSGIWRSVPPGQTWVPGYWNKVSDGYQWVSGYWTNGATETEYHPEPPQSLEAGPSSEAPSPDQLWVSGCWLWRETRYMWRPGYWMVAKPDWVWVPAHYVWTPSGYVFFDGYWDYTLLRRGLLFAPVRFGPRLRAGFVYTPRLVLGLELLEASLFVRERYGHYYFGDYYAASYVGAGYYPWFSFHGSRFGYDPLYAHLEWTNIRRNPNWERELRATYAERRDKPEFRPPHTYAAFQEWSRRPEIAAKKEFVFARSLAETAKITNPAVRLEHINAQKAVEFKEHAVEARKMQEHRIELEKTIKHEERKVDVARPPVKVTLPKSPVFTKPEIKVLPAPHRPEPVHLPVTSKPQVVLPHPQEILHPDFKRGVPPKKP
jgi:hypothetical protein